MATFLIVLFGLLLAFFCYACIRAPRVIALYAHTEPEIFEGEVVATIGGNSIVRSSFGILYCLRNVLPIGTEVVISTPQEEEQKTVDFPKYHVSEKSGTRAQVVRRLNENVLLCRYGNKEILVECDEDSQAELTRKVEIPYRSYEALGTVYTETEDALVIPFIRLDEVWQIPVCFQES